MSPTEVLQLGDRAPRMLAFCAMIGTWIRTGQSLRAYRLLVRLFEGSLPKGTKAGAFVHVILVGWQPLREHEGRTGWTPEAWLMRLIQVSVPDWQSMDWTAEIRRCHREDAASAVEQKTTR